MPRRTRAGPKPAILEDDHSDAERTTPLPETPNRGQRMMREPLVELVNATNTPQRDASIVVEIDLSKPVRRSPRKAAARNSVNKENIGEITTDVQSVRASPAVRAVRHELKADHRQVSVSPMVRDTPRTSTSCAVTEARKQLQHDLANGGIRSTKGAADPTDDPTSCSPTTKAQTECALRHESTEDSVEAMDALEDAIAEVDAAMSPRMFKEEEEDALPIKSKVSRSPAIRLTGRLQKAANRETILAESKTLARSSNRQPQNAERKVVEQIQTNASKPIATPVRKVAGRPSTTGAKTTLNPVSVRKSPFVPARSSKPVTTPSFTLPGEAVAARLKAQREEREQRRNSGLVSKTVRGTSFAGPNNRARPATLHMFKTGDSKKRAVNTVGPAQARRIESVIRPRIPTDATAYKRRGVRNSSAETTSTQINGSTRANVKAPIRYPPKTLTEIFNPPGPAESTDARTLHAAKVPFSGTVVSRDRIIVQQRTGAKPATVRAPYVAASHRRANLIGALPPKVKSSTLGAIGRQCARPGVVQPAIAASNRKVQTTSSDAAKEAATRARIEAAEKGRAASREWAERQRVKAAAANTKAKRSLKFDVAVAEVEVEIGPEKTVV